MAGGHQDAGGGEGRNRVPLVRVDGPRNDGTGLTPQRMAMDPRLRAEFKSKRTREAEEVLALGDCLYFYAGYACPHFGDLVFVYDPSMSATWEGYATPFDSGGIIGFIHANGLAVLDEDKARYPSKLSEEERRPFRAYIDSHRRPLSQWQTDFDEFISGYYDHPADYVLGKRPKRDDPTGRHLRNGDRRAWTWEVQASCDHKLFDGLWLLCMSSDAKDVLTGALQDLPRVEQERWWQVIGNPLVFRWYEGFEKEGICRAAQEEIVTWL